MMDTCVIYTHSDGATDAYGSPSVTYSAGSAVACGYKPSSTREVQQGNETVIIDAQLRLAIGTAIGSRDRVQLTKRYGDSITPILFDVTGQPAQGPSGIVVNLRRVTDA